MEYFALVCAGHQRRCRTLAAASCSWAERGRRCLISKHLLMIFGLIAAASTSCRSAINQSINQTIL